MTTTLSSPILEKAGELISALFREKLPSWALYHNLTHTLEVVEACSEIGAAMKLDRNQMEVVLLAAWFHDVGYVEGAEEHEERSARRAEQFLSAERYDAARTAEVIGCIRATTIPQRPQTLLQEIVCDGDVFHMGKKRFRARGDSLRMELELRTGKSFTDAEWVRKNIEFINRCTFHTKHARKGYGPRRAKNLAKLQARLENIEEASGAGDSVSGVQKESDPGAGVEKSQKRRRHTLSAEGVPRALSLLALAEKRGARMAGSSALLLIAMGFLLVARWGMYPSYAVAGVFGVVVFSGSLFYAVLSLRPPGESKTFTGSGGVAMDDVKKSLGAKQRKVRISQDIFLLALLVSVLLFLAAYAGVLPVM